MRAALWLLALFGVAVAAALFAGNNPGTVTVFWPPYRIDLSLNLVLLLLVGAFLVVHTAIGALNGYVLSMWRFRGSQLFFGLLLFGCFLPFQVILLPASFTLGQLGLVVHGHVLAQLLGQRAGFEFAGLPQQTLGDHQ